LLCRPLLVATVILLLPLLLYLPSSSIIGIIGLLIIEHYILTADYRLLLKTKQKKRHRYKPKSKLQRWTKQKYKQHLHPLLRYYLPLLCKFMMALAQTIKHWATYLPIPEPIVYSKQRQKRGNYRHTRHVSPHRACRGSHSLCTARTRYMRLHTPCRRYPHQVCDKYCLRTLRSVSHCSSYRHQRWYREPHLVIPHTRPRGAPPNIPTSRRVHAYASPTAPDDPIRTYDSDSKVILVDNCCTTSITNDMNDFILPPRPTRTKVEGYNGIATATQVGTIKWQIADNQGKVHTIMLPNTYY
jgi:hypothetical protein